MGGMTPLAAAAKAFASCLLVGSLAVFCTYAARLSYVEAKGSFSVDAVDIRVEGSLPQGSHLQEGAQLPVSYSIRGNGADCYIRCKGEYVPVAGWEAEAAPSGCLPAQEDGGWFLAADGYAYYRPALGRGDTVEVEGLVGDAFAGQVPGFSYVFTVQAVQARNFSPDYSAESPWGGIDVQQGAGETVSLQQGGGLRCSVAYAGEAGGLSVSAEDFLSRLGLLLPGDSREGRVAVSNGGDGAVRLGLRVDCPGVSRGGVDLGDASALLDAMCFRVAREGSQTPLFEGSLRQFCGSGAVPLGEFAAGECCDLVFRASLPEWLDNGVAGLSGGLSLCFFAEDAAGAGADGVPSGGGVVLPGGGLGAPGSLDDGSDGPGSPDGPGPAPAGAGGVRGLLSATADFLGPVAPALVGVALLSGAASCVVAVHVRRRPAAGVLPGRRRGGRKVG